MAVARSMQTSQIQGLVITLEYNANTLRMTIVRWELPSGTIRVRIWSEGNLSIDQTLIGPTSGQNNIPGNYRMIETFDEEDGTPYLALDPRLTYSFEAYG